MYEKLPGKVKFVGMEMLKGFDVLDGGKVKFNGFDVLKGGIVKLKGNEPLGGIEKLPHPGVEKLPAIKLIADSVTSIGGYALTMADVTTP